ncbi:MAG: hypothetical protein RLZZ517_618 [Candidatus Parcubacteria bacterium]|jgi:hypothetical protein
MKKKVKAPPREAVATKAQKKRVIENLKELPIATYAYQKAGVPKATYYKWRDTDDEFREATNDALITGKLTMNDIAKSQLVKHINEGTLTAIIFWLKHHDPDFNPKIIIEMKDKRELSKEENLLLATALRNMGYHGTLLREKELRESFLKSTDPEIIEIENNLHKTLFGKGVKKEEEDPDRMVELGKLLTKLKDKKIIE